MATLLFLAVAFCLISAANTQVAQITLTVKVGQYVSMPCHSRIATPVDWFYKPSDTGADQQVCIRGEVVGTFRGKVWVDTTTPTYFNLIINNTRESDAGIYTCIEDAGLGPGTFVSRLVVIAPDDTTITNQLANITAGTSSSTARVETMNPRASDLDTYMAVTAVDQPEVVSTATSSDDTNATAEDPGIPKVALVAILVASTVAIVLVVVIIIIIVCHKSFGSKSTNEKKSDEEMSMVEDVKQKELVESPNEVAEEDSKQSPSNAHTDVEFQLLPSAQTNPLLSHGTVPEKPQESHFLQKAWDFIVPDILKQHPLKTISHPPLTTALTDIELRQNHMKETKSMFSATSLPRELHDTILCKAMKIFVKAMQPSGHPEIKSLIALAKVTKRWYRIITSCDDASRPQPVTTLPQKDEVVASVHLNDKIFVVVKSSRTINVYTSTDHRQLQPITVDDLKQPVDAVSWAENKSIVVADHEGGCLWTWALNGKTKKWPQLDSNTFPCSLSIAEGQLSVATLDHRLLTFDANGKKLRCIEFDCNADQFHVFMTPSNKLAVYIPQRLHRKMKRSSNTENDISLIVFYSPFYLTFDSQGRGFVTNCRKECIFQLTVGEMRRHRLLLSPYKEVIEEPKKLCYIDATDELLVCDKNNVKVYKVTHSQTWDLPLLTFM